MDWNTAPDGFQDSIPDRWVHPIYYDALNALFRTENALRILVFVVLKNTLNSNWDTPQVESDEAGKGSISSTAKRRRSQDSAYSYLGHDSNCPLMYLTAGELVRLMLSDSLWPKFAPWFSASKHVVEGKLNEISNIRNRFAHFRSLTPEDAAQIRINATQVLAPAEAKIIDMLDATDVVPSNCPEDWYKELKNIATARCRLTLVQSSDEEWVRIVLNYSAETLSHRHPFKAYASGKTTTLVTPQILNDYKEIAAHVTFVTERSNATRDENEFVFSKNVRFFFSRRILSAHYEAIASDLRGCMETITQQTDLIKEDNMARGSLVKSVPFTAHAEEAGKSGRVRWRIRNDAMAIPVGPSHPPEYWGNFSDHVIPHFFTDTRFYPWMPVAVCAESDDVPF